MKKNELTYNQLLLLARQWDLESEPVKCDQGLIFSAFGGKKLMCAVPLQEALFCYHLQKHLYERGFAKGLRFIPNKYGDAYGIWNDYGIYLTDFYENAEYQISCEYDLWRLAALLGQFHLAAQNLNIPHADLKQINMPTEYAFWLIEQPPPPMTVHMLPLYNELCEQSQKALEKINSQSLQNLCDTAVSQKLTAHGRFNENAVSEIYGELLITDYSSASYGLPVWDLAYLLNRGLLLLGKDNGIIQGALSEYQKFRDLSQEEKMILNDLMLLPMEFIFAISDWQEQKLTGDAFAEILMKEEKILPLRRNFEKKAGFYS